MVHTNFISNMCLRSLRTRALLLSVTAGMVASFSANAQYLTEDFESAFTGSPNAPAGWTQSRPSQLIGSPAPAGALTDGAKDWEQNSWTGTTYTLPSQGTPGAPVSGAGVLYMNDFYFGPLTSNLGSRRMESPSMDLSGSTSPYVRFFYGMSNGATTQNMRIMASADGGATWNPIHIITCNGVAGWQRVNVLVPAAYRTSTAKIGFEMTNIYGSNNYYIDLVTVDEFLPTSITSAATGNWNVGATWVGGVVPNANNHVVIDAGHTITADATGITRCQDLTVNNTGVFQANATATNVIHIMGNLSVNAGGTYNSFSGVNGRRTHVGGSLLNNGAMNFSVGAANASALWWVGGAPATFGGSGTFTGGFIGAIYHANPGGVTYNAPIESRGTTGFYLGAVNPNGNFTLGNNPLATQGMFVDMARGTLTSAPIFGPNPVVRSYLYNDGNLNFLPSNQLTITTGNEIQDIAGTRTVQGVISMQTHGNVQLAYPITINGTTSTTIATTATNMLNLSRGILISNGHVITINNGTFTGGTGATPSQLTPPTTHGCYVTGAIRINLPGSTTTARNFALGRGTAYNGTVPNANHLKTVVLSPGATAWASQTPTISLEAAPSGTVNAPLAALLTNYAYRVNLNGGPDLSATASIALRGMNYTFGGGANSDNLVGDQAELFVAQSSALTGGTWSNRSLTTGAGAFLANTLYTRTTATAAPGPIAPLGTNGGYFTLATSTNACTGTPTPGNTLSTIGAVCPGQNFTLSLQNATAGTGVTYQWQSADDAGFSLNLTNLGTSATQITNQTAAKHYRCIVTCPAGTPTNGNSAGLEVTMNAAPATPQNFSSATFPPDCWTKTGTTLIRNDANGFGVAGMGSAHWNFYTTGAGTTLTLTSPQFTAVPASWQVRFDGAGAAYTGGEIDRIFLETSTTGAAGPWTLVQEMTNAPGGTLNTIGGAGTTTANFVPTAGQWVTLSYPVATGTNAIRFRGLSGFGNSIFIDNIFVEAVPSCFPPSSITAVVNTATSATVNWTPFVGETYDVEIRTSGAAGSGATGLVYSQAGLAGPSYVASPLIANTDYFAYIRTNCGGPLSQWSTPVPFRTGLCLASVDNTIAGDFNISPVQFANINNPSASTAGYEDFTSVVGNVVPGQTYTLSIGRGTSYTFDQFQVYINWNQDFDFDDAGEAVFSSPIAPPIGAVTVNITIPANATPGARVMRIRRQYDGGGWPSNYTPCGNSGLGQVEDYTLNICNTAAATVTIADNCGGSTFDAIVNIANLGSGLPGSGTITYAVNGGSPTTVAGAIGSNSLTALGMVATTADNVTISVGNGTVCNLALGTFYSNCPVILNCSAPAVPTTYCYKNGDTRTFHYVADPGQTVSLNFIQGSIDLNDVVNFYNGPNNLSPSLGGGNFSGDMSTADFNSTGSDLFFEITSGASNSCFDGGQTTQWQWTVQCTPDCLPPDGFIDYVLPVSCNPPGFYLDVTVIDAGSADAGGTNPESTVNVEWTINGGSPGSVTGIGVFDPTQIGPFPLGSNVNVVLAHASNPLCNTDKGMFTQANTCPPANDLCANAQVLPINAIGGCPANAIQGTTAFATYDVTPAVTCNAGAGTIRDVWYTFNTGTISNPIQVRFTAGTAAGYSAEFYTSAAGTGPTCLGASFGCLASAAGGVNLTLTANTNYYMRVFTNSGTGTAGTFGVCLAGSSCPAPTTPTATAILNNSANIGWVGAAGNYIIEYGPAVSFTTAGTGATAGTGGTVVTATTSPRTITGLSASTQYRYFVRRDCGAGNYSFNTAFGLFTTLAAPPPSTNIAHATCAQAAVIPDNGCGTNTSLMAQFPVTTTGTSLGVDVQLTSVDLIVPHPYRSDLQISLISPSGQVRSLIQARGGAGLNFGDPAACPTGFMRLIAGGASLATLTANSPTGNWAPEQPLSGFTGTPNGNWIVRICDAFGGDVGTLEYVRLNFVPCVGPTFTVTAVPNCAMGQYSISVNISNMGSASSYAITNSANASTANATAIGSYVIGPFASGVPTTITLAHSGSAQCNAVTAPLVFTCPAGNDLCADAIPVSCNQTIFGSTQGSTATGAPPTCQNFVANTAGGVWYTTIGWNGTMSATTCPGGSFDTQVAVFTGSCGNFTCVAGNDDACALLSTATWTATQGTLYYIYVTGFGTTTGTFTLGVSCGDYSAPCPQNGVALTFQTDTYPGENSWEILNDAGTLVIVSGGPLPAANAMVTSTACLPDGCYRLRVLDSFGDGMVTGGFTGGYVLRNQGTNKRIIDNSNNFGGGSISAISGGGTFCLPIGTTDLIFSSCDKMDWVNYKYLVSHADAAVSAQWVVNGANNVQPANSGYEFWIFDPNGTYSYRRFRSHNVSDGFSPASATRAAHMKLNGWYNSALTPLVPQNVMMNVRVRGRVNGVNQAFGPACKMKLDNARAACPLVNLQDDPANTSDYSCGVTRTWGGSNTNANKVVARPPQFQPAPLAGGTGVRYQFRFRNAERCIVLPPRTSATLYLNWNTFVGQPLVASETYDVDVRVSKDLGATWCTGLATADQASNCADQIAWGKVCTVTISGAAAQVAPSNMVQQVNGGLTMYPNPNRGDQLVIALTHVDRNVGTVNVDMYDLTGQRVVTRAIAVQDGYLNTTMDLRGDLAAGIYLVNITAGTKTYTERLVIQP